MMMRLCLSSLSLVLTATASAAASSVRVPESCRNFLLDAQVSGNVDSFHHGLRGTPQDLLYDPQTGEFARETPYHEYGVGFGEDLGVVPEDHAVWWQARWREPVQANLIVLSGAYENQPQGLTAWKIELHREGKWVSHARGVGGWYDRGRYVWGGSGTPAISFDGIRVSVFSKDDHTHLKSIHFRGEEGISWLVTSAPPIDAELKLPSGNLRVGQTGAFRAVPRHGTMKTWQWDFGDGTGAEGRDVDHAYAKLGSYRVRLTFSDAVHRAFRTGLVTVMPAHSLRLVFSPTAAIAGTPMRFEAKLDGPPITTCEWDFGDGTRTRGKIVQHCFAKPGVYRVMLRASDGTYGEEGTAMVLVRDPEAADTIPIWIDTDIGGDIDDTVCLLLAARDPRIEIVGVSTVRGCIGAVDVAAWLCRQLLQRAGLPRIPVLPGAVATISGDGAWAEGVGTYGELGPPPAPLSPANDAARVKAIADTMRAVGKPFHLLTIGPMTNAAYLVERFPDVAERWLSVTCMAGQLSSGAECNVRLDPEATRIVCEKLHPRLVAMEAIGPAIPRREADAALDPADPASAFLLTCYEHYRRHAGWTSQPVDRRPLTVFDPTALLSIVRPDAFDFRVVGLSVQKDGAFRLDEKAPPVDYAFSSDWSILKPQMLALLGKKHTK